MLFADIHTACADGKEHVFVYPHIPGIRGIDITAHSTEKTAKLQTGVLNEELCSAPPLTFAHCHTGTSPGALTPSARSVDGGDDIGVAVYLEYMCAPYRHHLPPVRHAIVVPLLTRTIEYGLDADAVRLVRIIRNTERRRCSGAEDVCMTPFYLLSALLSAQFNHFYLGYHNALKNEFLPTYGVGTDTFFNTVQLYTSTFVREWR
jgi:hypothetical protein